MNLLKLLQSFWKRFKVTRAKAVAVAPKINLDHYPLTSQLYPKRLTYMANDVCMVDLEALCELWVRSPITPAGYYGFDGLVNYLLQTNSELGRPAISFQTGLADCLFNAYQTTNVQVGSDGRILTYLYNPTPEDRYYVTLNVSRANNPVLELTGPSITYTSESLGPEEIGKRVRELEIRILQTLKEFVRKPINYLNHYSVNSEELRSGVVAKVREWYLKEQGDVYNETEDWYKHYVSLMLKDLNVMFNSVEISKLQQQLCKPEFGISRLKEGFIYIEYDSGSGVWVIPVIEVTSKVAGGGNIEYELTLIDSFSPSENFYLIKYVDSKLMGIANEG